LPDPVDTSFVMLPLTRERSVDQGQPNAKALNADGHLRLVFDVGSEDLSDGHRSEIVERATALAEEIARQHNDDGDSMHVTVHMHGGGNGGFLSKGAHAVGLKRADVVRE